MLKKILNLKAGILAFEISFIFCFFIGIFWNPPIATELFDQNHKFYINRGYPTAWAGVSAADRKVEIPIIKMPFLTRELVFDGSKWTKIIDLRIFAPLFIKTFLISYAFTFIFVKASEENKAFNIALIPAYYILLTICTFVYFFWFPRI